MCLVRPSREVPDSLTPRPLVEPAGSAISRSFFQHLVPRLASLESRASDRIRTCVTALQERGYASQLHWQDLLNGSEPPDIPFQSGVQRRLLKAEARLELNQHSGGWAYLPCVVIPGRNRYACGLRFQDFVATVEFSNFDVTCRPPGARTPDPRIKSPLLFQLS